MPQNRSTKIRRYTGSQWDYLNPETTIQQVVGLSAALSDRVHVDLLGANEGVPTLDASGKLLMGFLPEEALGGMMFRGTHSLTTLPDIDENYRGGEYWIITDDVSITIPTGHQYKDEHGVVQSPAVLQPGDWLFFLDDDGTTKLWSVVNNNQSDRYLNLAGGTLSGPLSIPSHRLTADNVKGNTFRFSNGLDPAVSRVVKYMEDGGLGNLLEVDGKAILHQDNVNNYDLNAATLEGQTAAYYRNADNINAGTLASARIPDYISATQVDALLAVKNRTYIGTAIPTADNLAAGDIWYDTNE